MVTELVEHRLLVGCRVFQEGYAIWPAGHPPKLATEVAAMLTALVLVQEEAILLQLIGQLLLLVISCVLAYCTEEPDVYHMS